MALATTTPPYDINFLFVKSHIPSDHWTRLDIIGLMRKMTVCLQRNRTQQPLHTRPPFGRFFIYLIKMPGKIHQFNKCKKF